MINEIKSAAARGVDMIVFPELCVPGYVIGDMPEDESFVRDVWHWNDQIVAATKGLSIVVIFGSYAIDRVGAVGEDGRLRKINAGFVAQNGELIQNLSGRLFFAKTLMPKYRMFDDERHYLSAQKLATEYRRDIEDLLQPYAVSIRGQDIRVGAMICEDMWDKDYAIKPGSIYVEQGINLMVNISCSPWGWQKNRARHENVRRLAADIKVPFVYVNNAGVQNNGKNFIVFDGASTVYNEHGDVAAYLPPYFTGVEDVVVATGMSPVSYVEADDVTQLWRGIETGARSYFATIPKNLRKVVIGLSGGIDSAVVATIMVHILGRENVIGINMPYGDYNSVATRDAAAQLAKNLGIEYLVMPIDDEVNAKAARHGISPGSGEFKTVQAVIRMTELVAHGSVVNAIYTCNGNKSESAFGFFTRDADGRGSIALLGDLLKGEVYQLAHYLNTVVYGREVIPQATIDVDPMDELGPQVAGAVRKDPFDYGRVDAAGNLIRGYHDAWVHAVVGYRKNPEWFLEQYLAGTLESALLLPEGKVQKLFPTATAFVADLERCWKLFWAASQKRVQSVPNILVSKRAFGWDYRESVLGAEYTERYCELRDSIPELRR
jgi:NAD+ synthase (glutamine-hydrolysing)